MPTATLDSKKTTFKAGDRVRCVRADYDGKLTEGGIYTVESVNGPDAWDTPGNLVLKEARRARGDGSFLANRFEIAVAKVGDRIRGTWWKKGQEGVITKVNEVYGEWVVKLDDGEKTTFYKNEFDLISSTPAKPAEAASADFKVGDRFMVLAGKDYAGADVKAGDTGVITASREPSYTFGKRWSVQMDRAGFNGETKWWLPESAMGKVTFKVGERVRVTQDDAYGAIVKKGDLGTVKGVGVALYEVRMDSRNHLLPRFASGGDWRIPTKYLAAVETHTWKVGDRLAVLKDGANGALVKRGDTAVVVSVSHEYAELRAKMEGSTQHWYFSFENIEPAPALKLENGCFVTIAGGTDEWEVTYAGPYSCDLKRDKTTLTVRTADLTVVREKPAPPVVLNYYTNAEGAEPQAGDVFTQNGFTMFVSSDGKSVRNASGKEYKLNDPAWIYAVGLDYTRTLLVRSGKPWSGVKA